jgi:hypothetical protein
MQLKQGHAVSFTAIERVTAIVWMRYVPECAGSPQVMKVLFGCGVRAMAVAEVKSATKINVPPTIVQAFHFLIMRPSSNIWARNVGG